MNSEVPATRLTRITLLRLICVWSTALFSGAVARLSTHPEPDTWHKEALALWPELRRETTRKTGTIYLQRPQLSKQSGHVTYLWHDPYLLAREATLSLRDICWTPGNVVLFLTSPQVAPSSMPWGPRARESHDPEVSRPGTRLSQREAAWPR